MQIPVQKSKFQDSAVMIFGISVAKRLHVALQCPQCSPQNRPSDHEPRLQQPQPFNEGVV
jgi:hypothetical protein